MSPKWLRSAAAVAAVISLVCVASPPLRTQGRIWASGHLGRGPIFVFIVRVSSVEKLAHRPSKIMTCRRGCSLIPPSPHVLIWNRLFQPLILHRSDWATRRLGAAAASSGPAFLGAAAVSFRRSSGASALH
jgi:hypothetical protein